MSEHPYLVPAAAAPVTPADHPSVSIVIACYNAAGTVGEAVRSALAQTVPASEVIVCDDGSTDDLDSALTPFLDRIVLLRRENRGPAAARNTAVRAASSEFVAILDADDVYEPRRIEALRALAALRPDLDLVTTDAFVEREGVPIGRLFDLCPFECADQRNAILSTSFVGAWPAVRRRRLLELGGFDESLRIAEDWDMWLRLILTGSLAGAVNVPLMTYRRHALGLTGVARRSHRAGIEMLERSRSNVNLSPSERRELERSIKRKLRRLALEEIDAAAVSGSRSALVRSSLQRGVPIRARLATLRTAVRPSGPACGDV